MQDGTTNAPSDVADITFLIRHLQLKSAQVAEVAQLTLNGDSFDRCLANFLDEFYAAPTANALADARKCSRQNSEKQVRCRTLISRRRRKNLRAHISWLCRRGPPLKHASCIAPGSRRRWRHCGWCCFWKARPVFAREIFSSARMH